MPNRLNDKEWDAVSAIISRVLSSQIRAKRDSNACAACGWHKPPEPNMDRANFYAGYTNACHDILFMVNSMISEIEDELHPVYDDELDEEGDEECED